MDQFTSSLEKKILQGISTLFTPKNRPGSDRKWLFEALSVVGSKQGLHIRTQRTRFRGGTLNHGGHREFFGTCRSALFATFQGLYLGRIMTS